MSAKNDIATKNDTASKKMTWAEKIDMDVEKMTWRAKISVDKSTVSEDQWLHSWLRARGSNPRRCTLKRTQPLEEGRGKRIASTLVFRKVVEKNFAQISPHRLTFQEKKLNKMFFLSSAARSLNSKKWYCWEKGFSRPQKQANVFQLLQWCH